MWFKVHSGCRGYFLSGMDYYFFLVEWEVGGGSVVYTSSQTYQSPLGFDQGSVLSVHFMVQSARIAQIMTGPIPAPERGGGGPTVHAFSSLCQIS